MEVKEMTALEKEKNTLSPGKGKDGLEKSGIQLLITTVLQFSRLIIFLIIIGVISLLSTNFLTVANFMNVGRQVVPQLIIALGMTLVLLTGGIDLSVGSTTTLVCVVLASVMKKLGIHWAPSIMIALAVGLSVGFVNGILITRAFLPAPLATYGMLWVGSGLAFAVMGVHPIFSFSESFRFIGTGSLFGIPFQIIIAFLLILLCIFILKYTVFGRSIFAVGSNYNAARASGIKSDKVLVKAYMFSGLMSAVAGVILLSRLNAVDQNAGESLLLPSIAAVVMGGTSMNGGEGGVLGTVFGAITIVIITNGMNLLGVSSLWQQFVIGLTVVLAVWLDSILKKKIND